MALLSQALHLGYLLSPHSAFQGHAAHTARWPAMLSPNGSSDTCISDGVFHIPMPCFHGALPVYPRRFRIPSCRFSRRTVSTAYAYYGPLDSHRWTRQQEWARQKLEALAQALAQEELLQVGIQDRVSMER